MMFSKEEGTLELKYSELGIASFSINIVSGIIIILAWSYMWYFFYFSLGILFMSLVALGLGIGGLRQKDRKKLFAILGTIFSVLLICGIGFLLLFSLIMATSSWT